MKKLAGKSLPTQQIPFSLPWGPAWKEELRIIDIGQDAYWEARRAMMNETQATSAAIRAACTALASAVGTENGN